MKHNFQYTIFTVLAFICIQANSQNKPKLSEIAPAGTITESIHDKPLDYNPSLNLFNYTRTWVPQKPIQDAALINEASTSQTVTQSTVYSDGNGNTLQKIDRFGISPTYHSVQFNDQRALVEQTYTYMPYAVNQALGTGFRHNVFSEQEAYYNTLYPAELNTSFSMTKVTSDVNGHKILKRYTPGLSQVGQGRGIESQSLYDNTSTIRKWTWDVVQNLPVSPSIYSPNELIYEKLNGEHNKEKRKYTDKEGRVVCTTVLSDANSNTIEYTYYVYDVLGRLITTIPPKAVDYLVANNLAANSWTIPQQIFENLCSVTIFDEQGRVIEKSIAGQEGLQSIVYDKYQRAVLSQDPNMKDQDIWLFTVYDEMGRNVMTGKLTSTEDRDWWQYVLDGTGTAPAGLPTTNDLTNLNKIYTYLINGLNLIQGGQSYPTSINDAEIMTYSYYDHYNHTALTGFSFDTDYQNHLYADAYTLEFGQEPALRIMPTRGLLTGYKERILKDQLTNNASTLTVLGDWVTSVSYYDNDGKVIQTQQKIEKLLSGQQNTNHYLDISTSMYDFNGRIVRSVLHHKNIVYNGVYPNQTNATSIDIIVQKYTYQPKTFKLLSVNQKINSQNWIQLSNYNYVANTGNLNLKQIGSIENQYYTYNIRGQLTGINPQYAESEVSAMNVTFGESIKYDYGFDKNRYDGHIAGIIWKTPSPRNRAYGYTYSTHAKLIEADFNQFQGSNNYTTQVDWKKSSIDLSEKDIIYDKNGNITALKRFGPTTVANFGMDDLNYVYEANSNRLQKVEDAIAYTPANGIIQDFQNNSNQSIEYTYDKNGNTLNDENKDLSTVYNIMNKPLRHTFGSGTTVEYIYTASGTKLEELTHASPNIEKRTFVGMFEYQNDIPEVFYHSEGKARKVTNSTTNVSTWSYDFFVKDHLGNVRTTVTAEQGNMLDYFAAHEVAYANIEQLLFDNIDNVRAARPGTPEYDNSEAARLDATDPEKRIGTAILLHVMAGDKFSLSADAYYHTDDTTGQQGQVGGNEMLESIVGTLLSNQSGFNNNEGMSTAETVQGVFTPANYIDAYTNILEQATDSNKPRSYLNYLVFDEEMNLIESQSGALQINAANAWHVLQTANEIELNQGGYLAVYISNESMDQLTYYDNIHINYYKGKLQEENHYYPYGLCLRTSQATGIDPNNHLYQTKEFLGMVGTNDALNLYDFGARQYDAILGRFTSLDPMGQFASGYVGMGNNPVSLTDPSGMFVSDNLDMAYVKQKLHAEEQQTAAGIANDMSNNTASQELMASSAGADYAMSTSDQYFSASEYYANQDNLNKQEQYTNAVRKALHDKDPLGRSYENWSVHACQAKLDEINNNETSVIGEDGDVYNGNAKEILVDGVVYPIGDDLDTKKGGFLGTSEEEAIRFITDFSDKEHIELNYTELNIKGQNYYYISATEFINTKGEVDNNTEYYSNRNIPEELAEYSTYQNHSHNTGPSWLGEPSNGDHAIAWKSPIKNYITEKIGGQIYIFEIRKSWNQTGYYRKSGTLEYKSSWPTIEFRMNDFLNRKR